MKNNPPPRFHLMAKPTGAICNLACSYCFFLDKELLYPGSPFRMSDEVLENYIRQLIEGHRTPQVTVAWQGGEPTLMGLDFYRRAIEFQNKFRKPGMTFENTMQTNATLLDDEWCEFFKENNYLIGISIDGPRELHDAYRVNKAGAGTFDKVMAAMDELYDAGVLFGNSLTATNQNVEEILSDDLLYDIENLTQKINDVYENYDNYEKAFNEIKIMYKNKGYVIPTL